MVNGSAGVTIGSRMMTASELAEDVRSELESGRAASDRSDWHAAYDVYRPHLPVLEAGDLERFAEACWWTGRLDECIAARESAFRSYVKEANARRAGLVALDLARDHGASGAGATAQGWFAQAKRLLGDDEDCVEHGFLLRSYADSALRNGEFDQAIELGQRVTEYGSRFGTRDLVTLGVHEQGRALVARGDVEDGLSLLDEAMVSAVSGELAPFWTGAVYCNLINACRDLADYRRAGEWTKVAERWCEQQSIAGFPGICRVRRGEILRIRGAWAQAEREMRQACEELSRHYVVYAGAAFYEIGEIRLRMGDLEAAEEALEQAHQLGEDPQPALALLQLARGDVMGAAGAIRNALTDETRPPLGRARLLPAATEILLAAQDIEAAETVATELAETAATYGSDALQAAACTAKGSVAFARGDAASAQATLRGAVSGWQAIDAPYETARARLVLADVCDSLGDTLTADLERDAARRTFEELGAALPVGVGGVAGPVPVDVVRTFVFTDIERSTELVSVLGDVAWAGVRRWHDRLVRELASSQDGEIVKDVGDGFFLAFPSAGAATRWAVSLQRALEEHRSTQGFAPTVRVGIHAGAAIEESGDYSGQGVNIAARIAAATAGGEITASLSTLVAEQLDVPVSDPRKVELRGIPEAVELVSIDWKGR